jgi:putative ABC transport system permease protein
MIKNMILAAFRNMFRNRSFTLINLVGFSISMSLGLLIILIIKSQSSFDTYHQQPENIYRINTEAIRTSGEREPYATVPLAIATALQEEYAYSDELVRLDRQLRGEVTMGDKTLPLRGLFADPSFLKVFNFPLAQSEPDPLTKPNSIVITAETAGRWFGDQPALGKTVTLSQYGEFTVVGVLKPLPGPTHLEFEAIASMSSVPVLEKQGVISNTLEDIGNYYTSYAYIRLKSGVTPEAVEQALEKITSRRYAEASLETRDKGYRFYLQALPDITPGPALSNNMGSGMPEFLLIFMGSLALVVMIMACFNYTQLTIAKSLTRAREIGVRKIVGANRWQVFVQFVGEAIVFCLLAVVVSYGVLQILKPGFLQLHITQEFSVNLEEDWQVLSLFVSFAVVTGIIAGLLPAVYLSAFKPLTILRGSGGVAGQARMTLRKALMTVQLTLSLIFLLLVMIIHQQINYMVDADYGFREENLVNVRLGAVPFERYAQSLNKISGVESVGGVSHSLGTWADGASDYKRNPEDELFVMRDFSVDEHYLPNLDVPLVAGKHFVAGVPGQIMLNETALSHFKFASAHEALQQVIYLGDSTQLRVVGVVKDFHFRPLSYQIGPVVFRYDPQNITMVTARVSGDIHTTVAQMEAAWKKLDAHPFEWSLMKDEIDRAYADAGFFDIRIMVGYITVVAMTLACLGILGMAMYLAQTRTREIGIRKVMGASVPDILILLLRSFLVLISIAVVIGVPLSYLLSGVFLEQYAYKIDVTVGLVLTGVLSMMTLVAVIILSQTWRAARANPVHALRNE